MLKFLKPVLLLIFVSVALYAQPAHNEQILSASGGDAVAMDKDWAVVGDIDNNQALIYKLNYANMQHDPMDMWELKQTVAVPYDGKFGTSVAISNDIMVVGDTGGEGELYAFNGDNSGNNGVFIKNDIANDIWDDAPDFSGKVGDGASLVSVGTRYIYGIDAGNGGQQQGTFAVFDKESELWTELSKSLNARLGRGMDLAYDGDDTIYAIEGAYKQGNTYHPSENIYTYSISGDTWSLLLSDIPEGTDQGASISYYEGHLVVIPGGGSTNTYQYSLSATSWETRTGTESVTVGGDAVIGGDNGLYSMVADATADKTTFRQLGMSNSEPWTILTPLPADVGDGASLAVSSEYIYAVMGGGSNAVYRYSFADGTWTQMNNTNLTIDTGGALTFSGANERAYVYTKQTDDSWSLDYTISLEHPGVQDAFGTSVGVQGDATSAQIVVGAPTASPGLSASGAVYAYSWNGSTATLNTTLSGNVNHEHAFGKSLDIKGDYLIVGAPDEETTATNDFAGAAYTFNFSSSAWHDYPATYRIKRNEANKHFGTYVAINKDGNVSMIGEETAGQDRSRIFTNTGAAWTQSHSHDVTEGFRTGVDIDDGVYMFSRGDDTFNYFDFHDSPSGSSLFKAHATNPAIHSFNSVTLYKDQVIGSRPTSSEAVTIDIPCGIKPTHLVADEWAMVSVPCGDGTATVSEIFGDDMGAANAYCQTDSASEPCNWVMYKNGPNYTGKSADYVRVLETEAMELGKGYWIVADHNVILKADGDASAGTGITVRTQLDTTTIPLPANVGGFYFVDMPATGGNVLKKIMVGNPFPRVVKWKDVWVYDTGSGAKNLLQVVNTYINTAYVYDITKTSTTGQPYRAITTATPGFDDEFKPYEGFWIGQIPLITDIDTFQLALPFEK